jgi:hypothetical protein
LSPNFRQEICSPYYRNDSLKYDLKVVTGKKRLLL